MYKEYQFDFGIFDVNGQRYFIHGLDEGAASLLGDCELNIDTIYAQEVLQPTTTLRIPIIDIEEGGWSSGSLVDYKVKSKAGVFLKSPFFSGENDQDRVYVGSGMFKKIIEMAYKTKWNDFHENYDKNNIYGIQALHSIYIYVDDIRQVDLIGNLINDNKYNTTYIFKAFDNFGASINNTVLIFWLLAAMILLITTIHVILSFNSYLKVQQKDMGILKQLGYSVLNIFKIYSININTIFFKVGIGIVAYIILIGIVFIKMPFVTYIIYVIISVVILLTLINRTIILLVLKSYTKKDILTLLKTNKEFE